MTRTLWAGGALLCLASLTLYGFGMNNPNPMRWASIAVLVSAAAVIWTWRGAPVRVDRTMLAGLAFLIYAAASLLWTPDWREGVLSLYSLALLAGVFITVRYADRKRLEKCAPLVAMSAVFVSLGHGIVWPESFGGTGNENFQAELLILLIPVAAYGTVIWDQRVAGALCLMAATLGAFVLFAVNGSHATWAGLAGLGGFLVFVLCRFRFYKFTMLLVTIGCAVLWHKAGSAGQSIMQRIELTHNTLLMWLDHPIFGVGLGGFNHAYPAYQEAHIGLIPGRTLYGVTLFAGAAHNEYAQALALFGIVGTALLAAFVWSAFKDGYRDVSAGVALIVLSIIAGLSAVNFPLQNPATAIIGVAALATLSGPGKEITHAAAYRFFRRVRAYLFAMVHGVRLNPWRISHNTGAGLARH